MAGQLDAVESRVFTARDFALDLGGTLPECHLAYETHGHLNAAGDNAILMTHGYTSSGHVAGRFAPGSSITAREFTPTPPKPRPMGDTLPPSRI